MEYKLRLSEQDLQRVQFELQNLILSVANKQSARSVEEMATCTPYVLTLTPETSAAETPAAKGGKKKVEVHEG